MDDSILPPSASKQTPSPSLKTVPSLSLVRMLVALSLLGVLIIGFYLLFSKNPEERASLYDGEITIGVVPWPGYLGFYVARDKGFFEKRGLDVKIKSYETLSGLSDDYVKGLLQGRANLTLDAVTEALQGLDHKTILVVDYSSGADAIIAREGIRSLKDLKGKRIAYNFGTLEEYFLSYALETIGLSIDEVVGVNAYAEATEELLRDKAVDAAVVAEPFLGTYLKEGSYHTLISSKEARGLIADILTFRTDFIDRYPETVQEIVAAYFDTLDWIEKNQDEAFRILALEFNQSQEEVGGGQLLGLEIADRALNEEAFRSGFHSLSLYLQMGDIIKFVHTHGAQDKIVREIESGDIIDSRFLSFPQK